ncbi:MAG: PQQ-dependent sugar dehydrogenase [Pseudomonadota bacterium]
MRPTLKIIARPASPLPVNPKTLTFVSALAALLITFVASPSPSTAQVGDNASSCALEAATVATGLEFPWGLAFINAQTALITERPGGLQIVDLATGDATPVEGAPRVAANGQGGLLDVALAPDFAASGTIFFSFSEPRGGRTGTSIGRATLQGWDTTRPVLTDTDVLFQQSAPDGNGRHFGSRIVVLPDGTLAFTIGDRGTPPRSQDPFDHAGSVLRINQDGSVPSDNPFADGTAAQPEIWSTGHRNPQGATLDTATGVLWTVEHGARGGDEINQPQAGRNYGWPTISYGVNYSGTRIGIGTAADGLEQPVYFWDPSIAPSGMAILRGSALFPSWDGDMLVGALRSRALVRLNREGGNIIGEDRLFENALGRVRDVRQGPDGAIWLLIDDTNGSLVRVTPANGVC